MEPIRSLQASLCLSSASRVEYRYTEPGGELFGSLESAAPITRRRRNTVTFYAAIVETKHNVANRTIIWRERG
jgi:hypothetical protein